MKYFATIFDEHHEIVLAGDDGETLLNGTPKQARLTPIDDAGAFSLIVDNRSFRVFISADANEYVVSINGHPYTICLQDEKSRLLQSLITPEGEGRRQAQVKAPMPGLVMKILVEAGQQVTDGDGLVIIEAMKMENEIRARGEGRVVKILRKEGDSVEKDALLLTIE